MYDEPRICLTLSIRGLIFYAIFHIRLIMHSVLKYLAISIITFVRVIVIKIPSPARKLS